MRKIRFLTVLLASTVLFSTSVQADLILNGSFEILPSPLGIGTWTTYTAIDGWIAANGGQIEVRNSLAGAAQHGVVFVELDAHGNSSMSQTVSSVSGQAYTLSYFYAPRNGVAENSNIIELYMNNILLDSYTGYSRVGNVWTKRTFDVFGTGLDVITFKAAGVSDYLGGSIDNVSMVAVPETSIIMLFGLGLLSLVGFRKKIIM